MSTSSRLQQLLSCYHCNPSSHRPALIEFRQLLKRHLLFCRGPRRLLNFVCRASCKSPFTLHVGVHYITLLSTARPVDLFFLPGDALHASATFRPSVFHSRVTVERTILSPPGANECRHAGGPSISTKKSCIFLPALETPECVSYTHLTLPTKRIV